MPRPLSDSWQYFQVLGHVSNGNSKKAKCTFCGHEQSAAITRLHQHLLSRCTGIPIEIRQELKRKGENSREPEQSAIPTSYTPRQSLDYGFNPPLHNSNTLQSPSNTPIPQSTRVSTNSYYQPTQIPPRSTPNPVNFHATSQPQSERSQAMLDWRLARALFSANIPFEAVENLHMIEFFGHLHPGYKLPQAKRLEQLLLKEEHWDIIECETGSQLIPNAFTASTIQQQQQQQPRQQHTSNAAINLMMLSSDSSRATSSFNPPVDLEGSL